VLGETGCTVTGCTGTVDEERYSVVVETVDFSDSIFVAIEVNTRRVGERVLTVSADAKKPTETNFHLVS